MLAPVILFVYNRPDHAKRTIESLSENTQAYESELYIFSDGPKNKESVKSVTITREYINSIPNKQFFKKATIVESEQNKGLAQSIIFGVGEVIKQYGKVIVVEDDLITSPDFLTFLNASLDYFEKMNNIGSITGYNPIRKLPDGYPYDVFLAQRNCSLGWGTWKDRWEKVDWEATKYSTFRSNIGLRRRFNLYGQDRARRLDKQIRHKKSDSWSIKFGFWQFMNDLYTVYPKISRLQHEGWDGTGTHNEAAINLFNKFNNIIYNKKTPFELVVPPLEPRIIRLMNNLYSNGLKDIIKNIVTDYNEKLISFIR